MTFILNEHDWAADKIESGDIGKHPFETLRRVARYYMDEGYRKDAVRKLTESFLIRCKPDASPALWMDTLDKAVAYAAKHPAVNIGKIIVTKPEMDVIDGISGVQVKRLAFTLLCIAKYYDAVNPNANHWVYADDRDIMKMANITTSIRRQSSMYRQLHDAGLIGFSKRVDNTNVCVLFMTDGDTAVEIDDFRNLGNQYLLCKGERGFFRCENCGAVDHVQQRGSLDTRGRKNKYCRECGAARSHRNTAVS